MPLHPSLDSSTILPTFYRNILKSVDIPRRDAILLKRFQRACACDPHMEPSATQDEMYYKAFAQALQPRLVTSLIDALNQGKCPELEITLSDGKNILSSIGYGPFGSPQDFLYGFTSERFPHWSKALASMGFRSAVMVGSQRAVVTMAPRDLNFDNPTVIVDELSGAIATDFWETGALTGSKRTLTELLDSVYLTNSFPMYAHPSSVGSIDQDLDDITANLAAIPNQDGYSLVLAKLAADELAKIRSKPTAAKRLASYRLTLAKRRPVRPNEKQEQIALKYVQEGNLLQKLLGGRRVDHIQSNVKNQKNPLRSNGCEVDSIYRVIGEKAIVLVEAKSGSQISRSQLYQMYETFRLRLPNDWNVIVVGVLLSSPKPEMASEVRTVIDMTEIAFDDRYLGQITESLLNMTIRKHYRWLIHQD